MAYSGATQFVELARSRFWARVKRPAAGWGRAAETIWGPLVTLATLIVLDQLTRAGTPVTYPFTILLLTVVISAYLGGLRTGLVSAVLTVLYGVHFFSEPGLPIHYTAPSGSSLIVLCVATVTVAVLVSRLHREANEGREAELTRAEAEALDRRLSFLSQASSALASSMDYEAALRELSRVIVPAMGDWCAIHVIDDHGAVRYIAGAHRDPARDLLVRVLCEGTDRPIPFGMPERGELAPIEVTEERIRLFAADEQQRKMYRSLKTTWALPVPVFANGRLSAVLTLGACRDFGRAFSEQDLRFARELADRLALAIGAGRVFHDAREADRRYRLLFHANPQPMWQFDVETLEFIAVNDAVVRHYGYSRDEFLAMTIMDIRPTEDTPGLPMAGHPGRRDAAFTRHQRKDGTVMDVELVSHELEMDGRKTRLVMATDISERARTHAALHQSEEQLRQMQRLDAVGRLAGGIAHDFNNILTTVRGFGDLLHRQLEEGDPRRADVEQIRKAADRGVLLTSQLLAFGQRQQPMPRLLDLHQVIQSMDGLFRRLLGADISLELKLMPEAAMVLMDPGHLDQVLVNIVLNARDAMPNGGVLTIETAERHIRSGAKARRVRPGPYLQLAIRDTGRGMDGETREHVFEPFRSADPKEHRAGLGLSIAYGIVRQNGGVMRVASEPEQGTTVKMYLPKADPDEALSGEADALRGTETVMVVEDEDGVRELVRQVLVEHGHPVLTARHGRDALMVAERYERPIDLLVTDVVMPELGGKDLVDRLKAGRPGLKVLFISGYTNDEILRRGVNGAEVNFLHKPFTSEVLMQRVRDALSGAVPVAT